MLNSIAEPYQQGFDDLIPWADPYIVALVRKLERTTDAELDEPWPAAVAELPPPLWELPQEAAAPLTRGGARASRIWPQ